MPASAPLPQTLLEVSDAWVRVSTAGLGTEMLTHHPNPDLKGNQPWPAKPSAPGLTSARSLPSFEKYY
ncbi:Sarcoplasmic/Endoplasmic Reticulum Calcium Atpase 1 [Manis pentadactyla]|nr:Sarcoplasmic/Endoplasmic Reticulum Calcium Atpase 1 [Manis pentadactyla]